MEKIHAQNTSKASSTHQKFDQRKRPDHVVCLDAVFLHGFTSFFDDGLSSLPLPGVPADGENIFMVLPLDTILQGMTT